VICVLVIVSLIAGIAYYQLGYIYTCKLNNGGLKHKDVAKNILQTCNYATNTAFSLAHWLFAFSYFVLSQQMELTANNLPLDTYDCRLNTLNIVVCVFNVVVPAISWIYYAHEELKLGDMFNQFLQASLILSCILLAWAMRRMMRFFGAVDHMLPNKVIMGLHIVAYVLLVAVNFAQFVTWNYVSPEAFEVTTVVTLVVYFFCTLIWGFIINTIVTKIETATKKLESESSDATLADLTASFFDQSQLERMDSEIEDGSPGAQVRVDLFEKGSVPDGVIATLFEQVD